MKPLVDPPSMTADDPCEDKEHRKREVDFSCDTSLPQVWRFFVLLQVPSHTIFRFPLLDGTERRAIRRVYCCCRGSSCRGPCCWSLSSAHDNIVWYTGLGKGASTCQPLSSQFAISGTRAILIFLSQNSAVSAVTRDTCNR